MLLLPLEVAGASYVARFMRMCDRAECEEMVHRLDPTDIARRLVLTACDGALICANNGCPVAVVAATEIVPGTVEVAMIATDRWPEVSAPVTRWARLDLIPRLREMGASRAECRSLATHAIAHRWLERLGFTHETDLPDFGKNRETFRPLCQ
ncbi:MAG: hypothetical protein U9N14_03245 [Pseudomonadota bacterium]|nr:hypothetical protein [Pseudomonadota bacterium]